MKERHQYALGGPHPQEVSCLVLAKKDQNGGAPHQDVLTERRSGFCLLLSQRLEVMGSMHLGSVLLLFPVLLEEVAEAAESMYT